MNPGNRNTHRGRPAVLFAVAAILSAGLTATLASSLNQAMPKVGDILVFAPDDPPGDASSTRISVHRPGRTGCVLDLATIRQTGGSFVVDARVVRPVPGFRLHWAGERTGSASDDCGDNADLFVGTGDLGFLATAAGGFGLSSQHSSTIASAVFE